MCERLENTGCPRVWDPCWKSKAAAKVDSSRTQGRRNLILVVVVVVVVDKKEAAKQYKKDTPPLKKKRPGFAYKLKVANSPAVDDINKTVVLTATISGTENTERPQWSALLYPPRSSAKKKHSGSIKNGGIFFLVDKGIVTQLPALLMFS